MAQTVCWTEICGEIRQYYPDKKVTLVHALDGLLNEAYPAHFRKALLDAVQDRGIEVVLKDRAIVPEGTYSSITTENGLVIPADLVVSCLEHVPSGLKVLSTPS